MHIVYVCDEYPPTVAGGIGTAVAVLARGMVKAGHRVTVVGFYPNGLGVRNSTEHDDGVVVHRYVLRDGNKAIAHAIARWLLRERIKSIHSQHPIDVIEWPDFGGWYLKSIRGIVDVVKVHGGSISHRVHGLAKRKLFKEYLELRTLRLIPNWIGVSQWFNDEWRVFSKAKLRRETIIYNPVNTEVFVPGRRQPHVVVYSGGLRARKGVRVLARAASVFLPANPKSRLLMIGYDSDLSKSDVLKEAGAGASQIDFLPFMPQRELAGALNSAGIFAMPSLYESCGNGWIEAMSCSLPVVGSTASCGPEIVSDGRTGLLANPEDPTDVARKVTQLLRDPVMATRFGQAGRERVMERFSLNIAVAKSEEFYAACCS